MSKQLYKVQITNHCEAVLRDTAYSIAVDLSAPEEAISWAMKMREQIKSVSHGCCCNGGSFFLSGKLGWKCVMKGCATACLRVAAFFLLEYVLIIR
jgi:hypothetical protein